MKNQNYKPKNTKLIKLRKKLYERRNTLYVFLTAIILTAIFYLVNVFSTFNLINFIATNIWCQTIIVFLTISSFINIFYPFTIRRELKEKDIEKKIIDKKIEDDSKKKEDDKNEKIREQATIR